MYRLACLPEASNSTALLCLLALNNITWDIVRKPDQNVDPRVQPRNPALLQTASAPDCASGSHVAPPGLVFAFRGGLGGDYSQGAFIGEYGSWNRQALAEYKGLWANGLPWHQPRDFVTGFIDGNGRTRGRPAGVAFDPGRKALLVADDLSNTIWRVMSLG